MNCKMKGPLYLSCEMNLVRELPCRTFMWNKPYLYVVMLRVKIFQNEINLNSLQEGLIIKSPWAHWESAGGGCKPSICSIVTPSFLSRAAGCN